MSDAIFWLASRSEQKWLTRKLQQAAASWCDHWSRENLPLTVDLLGSASDIPVRMYRWQQGTTQDGLSVAVGVPIDTDWGLRFVLTGLAYDEVGAVRGAAACEIETAVLRGFVCTLLVQSGALTTETPIVWRTELPDAGALDSTRGFVAAECRIPGSHTALSVVLFPETTRAYLADLTISAQHSKIAVRSLRQAVESQTINVEVIAGQAELLLQEIAALSVGDVLRLNRKIDEPLRVVIADSDLPVTGYLGMTGTRKAIQLISAP